MKKALFFAGLAAAALTFVGCNKEADYAPTGRQVGIILTDAQTRTVNSGLSTKWEADDALNVFVAPAGTDTYSTNAQFVVDNPETNNATGTVDLSAASAYDWFVSYPYDKHITTPASTESGYMTIGSTSTGVQTQAGLDSKAHLAGTTLPVYGVAKNVDVTATPEVSMKHIASVIAVNLTNDTDKPLAVSTVSFTAPEDIVGTYYVDFTGDELDLVGSGANYVSKTATLSVTGDETIAAGASAKFYIAIKPFAAKVNDELTLSVIADQGEVEKTVKLTQASTFASGSIKTLNLSYQAPVVVPTITVADIKEAITSTTKSNPDSFTGQLAGAVVSFVSGSNAFIQDETGGILLYLNGHGLKAGDVLSGIVSGTGYVYNGLKEMISLTGFEKVGGEAPEAVSLSLEQLLADYDAYVSVRVKVTGVTVPAAFTNRNTTMTDGDASLALRDQKNGLTITPGMYDITGYPSYFNAAQFGVWTQDDIVSAGSVNIFDVTPQQIDVAATATSTQITVSGNVEWTAEASEGATIDKVSGTGSGVITVSFAANTTPEPKEYTVLVSTTATGVNDEFAVEITQAAASTEPKGYPFEWGFTENQGQGDFTINDVNKPAALDYVWSFDTRGFMKASAFKSNTNYDAESWLISPVVDLAAAQNPALTFAHATNYFTSVAKAQEETSVWVREEGGAWTAIEGVNYPTNLGWTFADSGSLDLSAYKGKKVQIGFKYTSTSTKSGTWEIQNFKLADATVDPVEPGVVTIDFSKQGLTNGQEVESVTDNGVTVSFDKGTNNNAPKYYDSGTAVRMYGSNSMTVTAGGKTIISIELTFGSSDGTNAITTNVPTYEEPAWTGEAGSVTFTIGGTTGQRRIKAIKVKYTDDAAPATPVNPTFTVTEALSVEVGATEKIDVTTNTDGAITYTSANTAVATVATDGTVTGVAAGSTTITVAAAATSAYTAASATVAVTVTAAVDGNVVSMTMTQYVEDHKCTVSAGSDATMYKILQLNPSVRMSTTGDDNCGSFWNTSNTNTTKQWRLYQNKGGNVIVSVAQGCELKSVKLTFTPSGNGILLDAVGNQVASDATLEVSGSSVTFTVGDTAENEDKGQIRVTAVEVVYTGDGTTFPDEPTETETKITMAGNASVYVGETVALNATSNVEGATITYESEDPTIASVSAAGVVTGVAEGTVKVFARIAGVEGQYTDAERYCNVTVSNKPDVVGGTWEATALSSIADGAEFILVSTKGDASYAMSNDNGTGSAPAAVSVTVSGNTLSNPASNLVFVLKKVEGGYVFGIKDKETTLYCFNNNNGLRVGTNAHNVFSLDSESGYLVINDGTQNRYIGVYNNADWRSYTTVHNNIKDQTFTFFVKK